MKSSYMMVIAFALSAHVFAAEDKPADATGTERVASAFGFKAGDVVPPNAVPLTSGVAEADKVLQLVKTPAKAGFDEVLVLYTDRQGVCKAAGSVNVESPGSDAYGYRHKAAADGLAERVTGKLGVAPTSRFDINVDDLFSDADEWLTALRRGNAQYVFVWMDSDAEPFGAVAVRAFFGRVSAEFEFKNYGECVAEQQEAVDAEF